MDVKINKSLLKFMKKILQFVQKIIDNKITQYYNISVDNWV